MKIAVMQPYFLPYIGYFQLISSVDQFIIYDNIKYTKKGWINRNRFLLNDADTLFSLPLQKGSDLLNIVDRKLAANFNRIKLLNQFKNAYRRAPQFYPNFPVIERIVMCEKVNLFHYIYQSIVQICNYLDIKTEIKTSSEINIDHGLRRQDKVLALCRAVGADTYINAKGGVDLYSRHDFISRGIELKFINTLPFEYEQFGAAFLPWLSIIDVLMFNELASVKTCINERYELI